MEKHEVFDYRLKSLNDFTATTTPEQNGFHFCTVLTKEKISEFVMKKLTEIAENISYEKGNFEDRKYCKLQHKYVFKIPTGIHNQK